MKYRPALFCLSALASLALLWQVVLADDAVTVSALKHQHEELFCAEACASMIGRKQGWSLSPDDAFALTGLDPVKGRPASFLEMAQVLHKLGFDKAQQSSTRPTWTKPAQSHEQAFKEVLNHLKADTPVMIRCADSQLKSWSRVILLCGLRPKVNELLALNPKAKTAPSAIAFQNLKSLWTQKNGTLQYMVLDSQSLKKPNPKRAQGYSKLDFARHIHRWKKRLNPDHSLTLVIEDPFVVFGDESAARVKSRAIKTVRWVVKHLKALYFKKDPNRILNVWLFKNHKTYKKHVWELFKDRPFSPYGYYSPSDDALIMNIGTGGGTLCHEIVHPFIESNFPGCPSWFNEGLASLYEQCGERNKSLVGFTNWRLKGLQTSIRNQKLPSFPSLMRTTRDQFYEQDRGTNYAQARYLCYYLQQKNKLQDFYKAFRDNVDSDKSGEKALAKVLAIKDWKAFQKTFESWALTLRYP